MGSFLCCMIKSISADDSRMIPFLVHTGFSKGICVKAQQMKGNLRWTTPPIPPEPARVCEFCRFSCADWYCFSFCRFTMVPF